MIDFHARLWSVLAAAAYQTLHEGFILDFVKFQKKNYSCVIFSKKYLFLLKLKPYQLLGTILFENMSMKPEIFVSYAWGGESEKIVNELDATLQSKGITIIRDKRDLGFKGEITDFMKKIGQGNAVIIVISDKYLKSPYCMFELLETYRNLSFKERIFPIVLQDANIFDPIIRLSYFDYWKNKKNELDEAIKKSGNEAIAVIGDDYIAYKKIFDNFGEVVNILKDINSLTPQMHRDENFKSMIEGIEKIVHSPNDKNSESEPNTTSKPMFQKGKTYEEIMDVFARKRIEALQKQIDMNFTLLEGYEQQKMLNPAPTVQMAAQIEIDKITNRLNEIQSEIDKLMK